MRLPVYLDYNATTPVDSAVLEAMLPWFSEQFGNAASRTHVYGWLAEEAVATARQQVANLLGADGKEIVFTSGATEANNLAIKGIFEQNQHKGNHIITATTEHKAVLDVCKHIEKQGTDITYLTPATDGIISAEQLQNALRPDTILVSIMLANNEIGTIQPLAELIEIAHQNDSLFHTDATQAIGKIKSDIAQYPADLLSLSAHKLYGPKGVGALYIRKGINVVAQIDGGGHERGRRSGTLNVPAIVGLGRACEIAQKQMESEAMRLTTLRDKVEKAILEIVPTAFVNGNIQHRLPHLTNICFDGYDGETLLLQLKDIAVSTGSACTSASIEPSHVLKSLGLTDEQAHASIRFSLGRYTDEAQIDFTIEHIREVLGKS